MSTWPCGTPKSASNAFSAHLMPTSPTPTPHKKPGPKKQPRSIRLPGTRSLDINSRPVVEPGYRSQVVIGTTDSDKTRRLLRAAI